MGLEINVDTLPPIQKKILLILPPVLIIALAVYLFIMPDMETSGKLGAELDNQTKFIDGLKKDTAKLGRIKADNEKIAAKLAELKRKLPDEKEISGLLKQISDLSIKEGLTIISWKPRPRLVHPSNEVYEIPLLVELKGRYHNVGMFFSKIAGLERLVNIANADIESSKENKDVKDLSLATVKFSANTYSIIPEKERKALKEKAKKEKEEKEKKEQKK